MLYIQVECPNCSVTGDVPETHSGKQIRCKKCGSHFTAASVAPRWYIQRKGTKKEGPFTPKQLKSIQSSAGMRVRREDESEWTSLPSDSTPPAELTEEVLSKAIAAAVATRRGKPSKVQRRQPIKMELGDGIMILRFPQASIAQNRNHIELIREVHAKGVFPQLRVYALVPKPSMSDGSHLIVVTGSVAEAQKVANVYYTPEAESYVNRRLSGNWTAINAESTSDNVPMPGCKVDLNSFQRRLDEVLQGDYTVEQIV
jgi:hypothetical protein